MRGETEGEKKERDVIQHRSVVAWALGRVQ